MASGCSNRCGSARPGSPPKRLPERHLHEIDSDRALRHLVHLTRGDTRGDLDQQRLVLGHEHLRVHDGVADAERSHHVAGDALDSRSRWPEDEDGSTCATATGSPRPRAAVGPGRVTISGSPPRTTTRPLTSSLARKLSTIASSFVDSPSAACRRASQVVDAAQVRTALTGAVGGLQHRRKADPLERVTPSWIVRTAAKAGARSRLRGTAPHRHLVGHAVRAQADARQAELLGDPATTGTARSEAIVTTPSTSYRADLRERRNVEADDLGLVRQVNPAPPRSDPPRRRGFRARGADDRAPRMAPGADEQGPLFTAADANLLDR